MRSPWHEAPRRRVAWFALIAAVVVAHALFGLRVAASVIGWDAADEPRRIDVSLVHPLAPTAPPEGAPDAPPPAVARGERAPAPAPTASSAEAAAREARERAREEALAQARAASQAEQAASASHDTLQAQALALAASLAAAHAASGAEAGADGATAGASPPASAPAVVASAASTAVAAAASAPVAGPPRRSFEWPPSTRLTYTLTGLYRNGALYGNAAVEWRREGTHYQVQFDIHVSPIFDQHMFSDGQLGDDGLRPRHYDESFKVPILAPRVRKVEFGDDEVTLTNGNRVPLIPQAQDSASQFVQFVWMFTAHPAWLRPGNVVEIPLALPHNLRVWRYQVGEREDLSMGFGHIDAVHLSPILTGPRKPNEYPFEIWTAPTLQYLPVRIRVSLDEQNFADLSLDSLPLQAAPTASSADPAPR